ncbi:MAG: carboxypeptidase regulatory-like domain-containing protein, partial [Candidatus Eremiobacteraeota bacterium]|nr:carboxypeptidase regulatory-like domain-containing protein [Candidatus Eremiobacteraeota bacterium]
MLSSLSTMSVVLEPAVAQTVSGQTRVAGSIVSPQGAPVSGAQLVFSRSNAVMHAISDADGAFTLLLGTGRYRLIVSAPGFRTLAEDVSVEATPLALHLELAPASGSLIEIGRVGVNSASTLSTSSNVTVQLNPQEAALRGVERVGDLLAEQIGVTAVRPNGGAPTLPLVVALRGPDPSETLIDIDGHEVNNSNTGDFDLSMLDPTDL